VDGNEPKGKGKGKGCVGWSVSTRPVGFTPQLGRHAAAKPHQEPEDWSHPFWRLADKLHQAEDHLMLDSDVLYLVGSGLLGVPAMLATHNAELQELWDNINSVRQEMELLWEDIGELFWQWRESNSVRSRWSEQMDEGVKKGSCYGCTYLPE